MENRNKAEPPTDTLGTTAPSTGGFATGTIHRSDFFRGVSVLMGGTIMAQLIPLLVLPVLSRLYTPESFAVVALVMMVASIAGPVSTGYYEQAITNPRSVRRARALAFIAMTCTVLSTLVIIFALCVAHARIARALTLDDGGLWLYALPLALCAGSIANITNYWLLRAGKHGLQSSVKLLYACCNAALAITLGTFLSGQGLLISFMGAVTLSTLWGLFSAYRHGMRPTRLPFRRYGLPLMRHYREFPLFGSLPATLNNIALQWPLLLITAHYTLTVAGHFSIIRNLLTGGLMLVALCIGQVLMKHLNARIHAGLPLWPFFSKVMAVVALLGVAGGVMLYTVGPWFLRFYLGEGWEESGTVLRTLAISSPLVLLGVSLAPALLALRRIRVMGLWQVFYMLASLGLLLFVTLPFSQFLGVLVATECMVYLVYIAAICHCVRQHDQGRTKRG